MSLFDLPPIRWPEWYRPTKARPLSNQRVARGRHPTGRDLGPEGSTCGACCHLRKRTRTRTWYKCPTAMGESGTARTDMVRTWRGCDLFAFRHESTATQAALPGQAERRLTTCGQLVPVDEATGPRDLRPVTCPACLGRSG